MKSKVLQFPLMTKQAEVCGTTVTLYSADGGLPWFTNKEEAVERKRQRQKFLSEPLKIPRLPREIERKSRKSGLDGTGRRIHV